MDSGGVLQRLRDARRLVGGEAGVILQWLVRGSQPARSPNTNHKWRDGPMTEPYTSSCCNPGRKGV
jgi:hypothetical protein